MIDLVDQYDPKLKRSKKLYIENFIYSRNVLCLTHETSST